MSKLVIVESPAKAKTIGKYLGKDYEVTASMGHIRDLPASQLGIDVEHDYTPQYISIKGKEKLIKELKSKAKHSDGVLLATDPDREGEAISWHLANILGLDPHEPNRVTFDEITKKGVQEGMAHPRAIDEDLFNAQQARRVLDRLVGYKLSPFLWRKVRRGLSAGRVQSVAVRLIDDREKEIESFKPEEYWNVDATLGVGHKSFTARLASDDKGKKLLPRTEPEARGIITAAAREVFEESGVLLASAPDGAAPIDERGDHWACEREAVATRQISFGEFLRERGLVLRSDLMRLRSHWVTPESEARRYDTYFFLARLPKGQHADGRTSEAVEAAWIAPGEALARFDAGLLKLVPPTISNLTSIVAATSVDEAWNAPFDGHVRPHPVARPCGEVVLGCEVSET